MLTKKRPPKPDRSAEFASFTPRPRATACAITDTRARLVVPIPKDAPVRSETYRRLVAAMPCIHCGKPAPSQCAHADQGKGLAIKASDLETFPLCADSPGRMGCHTMLGASGMMTREIRRELEAEYAAKTRQAIRSSGQWPKDISGYEEGQA